VPADDVGLDLGYKYLGDTGVCQHLSESETESEPTDENSLRRLEASQRQCRLREESLGRRLPGIHDEDAVDAKLEGSVVAAAKHHLAPLGLTPRDRLHARHPPAPPTVASANLDAMGRTCTDVASHTATSANIEAISSGVADAREGSTARDRRTGVPRHSSQATRDGLASDKVVGMTSTTQRHRHVRRARIARLAAATDDVLSRRELYAAGLTRAELRAELRAQRWKVHGSNTVAVHAGPISSRASMRRAVFEVGADAALDGVSALIFAGLEHFSSDVVHVSISKGARASRSRGVRIHETRRRRDDDLVTQGLPRVRNEIAAIRGALWASSNRQAALVLVMAVQQGLATAAQLVDANSSIKRDRRRSFIRGVLADIASGVQAIGELDFARLCRRYGIPEPDRQVPRRLPSGRVYLDAYWDRYRVVAEIEGMQHQLPGAAIDDSLRQNWLTVSRDAVLRIPVLGLRVAEADYMNQLAQVLRRNGWTG
jgi:hypothetical protein